METIYPHLAYRHVWIIIIIIIIILNGQRILTKGRATSRAVIEDSIMFLLRTPQRLPMLFSEPDKPQNCPFPWDLDPI